MIARIHQIDISILQAVQRLPNWARPLMVTFTFVGEPLVLLSIIAVFSIYMFIAKQILLVRVGAITALLLLVSPLLKIIFQRSRPEVIFASINQPKSYSFPSGHAYMSMLVLGLLAYLAITRLHQPWGIIIAILLAVFILGIGLSRIYLGVHYASDVLAGWVIAAVVLICLIKLSGI